MNHYSVAYMSDAFETKKNTQASMITLGVAISIFLLFLLWKLPLPTRQDIPLFADLVEVNIDIPEEIAPTIGGGGGGGGGNIVQATGPKGTAYSPPQSAKDDVKDIPDINDKETTPIVKPDVAKPKATKIDAANSVVKAKPKPVVYTPAPQKPKAVLGKTIGGDKTGGGVTDNYNRSGGNTGGGNGVGNNIGNGGNTGGGNGGGNGPGNGLGTGPKNFGTKRLQITNQSFEDDFNENASVAMDIEADANGKVISANFQPRGSTTSKRDYIDKARRVAFQLKTLGNSTGGQRGTVIFTFKVKS
jgi:hypothetical protein